MSYTVKQLANLSGVSVRTLHWYDEKGLLEPSYYGANGYRYYEKEQLLKLQQILFFRELEFSLDDIKRLLKEGFDQIKALQSHKHVLMQEVKRKNKLVETIDKTIAHLRGEKMLEEKDLYYGFDSDKQKEYEKYIVKEMGFESEERLRESQRRTAKWDKDEWDLVKQEGDKIHKALAEAIDMGLNEECDEVQKIIDQHYQMQNRFFDLTKEVYLGLTELYTYHPDFHKFFDVYHPDMVKYLSKAIRFYANERL